VAEFDVLIAGAGPAGCATALSLAAFAPELRVGLIGAGRDGVTVRIGETVPPQINPLLIHLGVWQEFCGCGHSPTYRTMAAWGDWRLAGNEFLSHAHQVGWRLDRAAFDRMLVNFASSHASAVFGARLVALAQEDRRWRVLLSDGGVHMADFVVDATGRGAVVARRCGVRPVAIDRLVGCWVRTGSRSDGTEGLLIESFAEGWWYTAALPWGDRVLVCMTDADRVRPLQLSSAEGFARLFAETDHIRRVAEIGEPPPRPAILPAASRFVPASPGLSLVGVGEAALACDPIAGDGIVRALRSGIFASYAIADWLRRGDARGLARYRLMLQREFATYRELRRDYYAREQRWPDSPFWRRRMGRRPSFPAEAARLCASSGSRSPRQVAYQHFE
jgi:2-polyprenyl-6-methoxyphenol hydroxylase-like FAD-dependent oxidoreductase